MITSAPPLLIRSAAIAIDWSPEEQKRLIVIALVSTGRPARIAAARATFIPCSASGIAQPMRSNVRFIALILLCSHLAHSQSGQAELTGEVRDQTGAAVANATVKITELSTNRTFNTTTSDAGIYIATNLKPGRYSITVDAPGFKQTLREPLTVSTGERLRIDVTLEAGAISESITIKDDASLLRSESGSLGQVIDNRKITNIPLNGRNFLSLVSLSAGVAQPPPTSGGPSFPRINGGRPRTNEYMRRL